jgi:hypothetical protein
MTGVQGLIAINFLRSLDKARPFEASAYKDVEQYIDNQGADFENAKLAAHWLENDHSGTADYICVMFLIPYSGGVGVVGYKLYLAMPERLFGAEVDSYLFGGVVELARNEEIALASGSTTGGRFGDFVTFLQGRIAQILAFQADETQYKLIYSAP